MQVAKKSKRSTAKFHCSSLNMYFHWKCILHLSLSGSCTCSPGSPPETLWKELALPFSNWLLSIVCSCSPVTSPWSGVLLRDRFQDSSSRQQGRSLCLPLFSVPSCTAFVHCGDLKASGIAVLCGLFTILQVPAQQYVGTLKILRHLVCRTCHVLGRSLCRFLFLLIAQNLVLWLCELCLILRIAGCKDTLDGMVW